MAFWGTTMPPLWAIYAGQLMIATVTVVCFFLILRRLNEHLQQTVEVAVGLIVKQQELTKLMADELAIHVQGELRAADQTNLKLDALLRERAAHPAH